MKELVHHTLRNACKVNNRVQSILKHLNQRWLIKVLINLKASIQVSRDTLKLRMRSLDLMKSLKEQARKVNQCLKKVVAQS